jgi:hypothetical protein
MSGGGAAAEWGVTPWSTLFPGAVNVGTSGGGAVTLTSAYGATGTLGAPWADYQPAELAPRLPAMRAAPYATLTGGGAASTGGVLPYGQSSPYGTARSYGAAGGSYGLTAEVADAAAAVEDPFLAAPRWRLQNVPGVGRLQQTPNGRHVPLLSRGLAAAASPGRPGSAVAAAAALATTARGSGGGAAAGAAASPAARARAYGQWRATVDRQRSLYDSYVASALSGSSFRGRDPGLGHSQGLAPGQTHGHGHGDGRRRRLSDGGGGGMMTLFATQVGTAPFAPWPAPPLPLSLRPCFVRKALPKATWCAAHDSKLRTYGT